DDEWAGVVVGVAGVLAGEGLIHQLRLTGVTRAVELLHRAAGENHAGGQAGESEQGDGGLHRCTWHGDRAECRRAWSPRRHELDHVGLDPAETVEFGLASILGLDEPLAVPAVALVNAAGPG